MAQDAHQPIAVAALHFAHEAAFDAHQPPVGEVERNRDSRYAVGREPFLRKPAMRAKADPALLQFAVQALDGILEIRAPDRELQVAETQAQQLVVAEGLPCTARTPRAGAPASHRRIPPRARAVAQREIARRGPRNRTAWGPRAATRRHCKYWRRSTRCGPGTSPPSRAACASLPAAACWS